MPSGNISPKIIILCGKMHLTPLLTRIFQLHNTFFECSNNNKLSFFKNDLAKITSFQCSHSFCSKKGMLVTPMSDYCSDYSTQLRICLTIFIFFILQKYPELYFYEGILEANNMPHLGSNQNFQYLPTYFDHVCLRMLPVSCLHRHKGF